MDRTASDTAVGARGAAGVRGCTACLPDWGGSPPSADGARALTAGAGEAYGALTVSCCSPRGRWRRATAQHTGSGSERARCRTGHPLPGTGAYPLRCGSLRALTSEAHAQIHRMCLERSHLPVTSTDDRYPALAAWVQRHGWIEIGHCPDHRWRPPLD